ncbi:MAG TPA: FmdB family zinc ribbon protein [candidate division Zixibacteria bacterium]|nr:FmdB family zinc ribbon protein [candidate division Zixibacteria bacterium]
MPTYDYECRSCGRITEVIHSMLEDGPTTCEHCGGQLRRVLYPTGIIFKGSGFYKTDSRAGNAGSGSSTTDGDATSRASDGAASKPATGSSTAAASDS